MGGYGGSWTRDHKGLDQSSTTQTLFFFLTVKMVHLFLFTYLLIWLHCAACRILGPRPRIEPPALESKFLTTGPPEKFLLKL